MFKKFFAALVVAFTLSASVYATEIPVDAKLDYNQGIDFYKLGMYERAIECFRSATRTYPDYIDAYYNLGTILEYLRNYSEATVIFKQIYLRNPHDYEVIYKLAKLSAKQEDYTKAAEYIKLIPPSSEYYNQSQELASTIRVNTITPKKEENTPSTIANNTGVYENILSPTGVTTDKEGNILNYYYLHTDYYYPGTAQFDWQGRNLSFGFITQLNQYKGQIDKSGYEAYNDYIVWQSGYSEFVNEMPSEIDYDSWRRVDGTYVDLQDNLDPTGAPTLISQYESTLNAYLENKKDYFETLDLILECESKLHRIGEAVTVNSGTSDNKNLYIY